MMNADKVNRIKAAIADCDRYIEREARRAYDLRPADVAKLLQFYRDHRAKLVAMLEGE